MSTSSQEAKSTPVFGAPGPRSLAWLVKASLLDYLEALDDAEITGVRGPHGFVFEGSYDGVDALACTGEIRLAAHAGRLDIVIREPRITHRGDSGILSAQTAAGPSAVRVDIARLGPVTRHDGVATIEDVALTLEGSAMFDGHYGPYTRMAPLRISPRTSESA